MMLLFSMTILSVKIAANESASDLLDHPLALQFQHIFQLRNIKNIYRGKGNIFKDIEMLVMRDNRIGICRHGAINKFIVVIVSQ
jgi:hypothetical protein